MRSIRIEIHRVDEGWTAVTFEDIESVRIAGTPGSTDNGLVFTLIGIREDTSNQVVTDVVDIAARHRDLLDSEVPTINDVALPVALQHDSPRVDGSGRGP